MRTTTFRLFSLQFLLFLAISLSAQVNSKADLAKQLLLPKLAELNLSPNELSTMKISSETYSENSGVSNIYFQQYINEIPVHGAILNAHVTANNQLLTYGSRFVTSHGDDVKGSVLPTIPSLSAEQALYAALGHLGIPAAGPLVQISSDNGPIRETVFDKGTIAMESIKMQLVYQPIGDNGTVVRLAWQVEIQTTDSQNWWLARVDAETGELLDKNNYTLHCNFGVAAGGHSHHEHKDCNAAHSQLDKEMDFSAPHELFSPPMAPPILNRYKVYQQPAESPNHVAPFPPADGRVTVDNPASATASPFGWHDTDGVAGAEFTITRGNNVHAYTDTNNDNVADPGSSPDGGADLEFVFPIDLTQAPSTYQPAAVTNLFYWNNYIHDFAYAYGFTPLNGNFQVNNYGGGGSGNDDVRAEAQDGGGTNNANFSTPPDGQRPRMQMYIGTSPNPDVDGSLDNGVVAHEYGHGISNRFTGGPANTSCLGNQEQMGEGWSDFYALMTTIEPGDLGTDSRGIGTYLFGQPANGNGIRPTPYSTNMAINPATYNTIKTASIPHGIGYVWCGMIWDLTWAMIADHGNTPGFNIAMNLVNEGMRLQPCSPGFVDGRNAILAADVALYGGANTCRIWEVFARRGLGFSASQGSSNNRSDGTEAFDMPSTCFVDAEPEVVSICAPANAVYTVTIGRAVFNGPINLTVPGLPAGATANFSLNPIPQTGGVSTLTISNTGSAAPGNYTLTVTATSGATVKTDDVVLRIQNSTPTTPTLVSPPNLALNQFTPLLTWNAVSNASTYDVQVSLVPTFATTVANVTGLTTTNYQIVATLSPNTTYYWRVRGVNTCGQGTWAAAFRFQTYNSDCFVNNVSTNVPITISASGTPTVNSTLSISGIVGNIISIKVKNLNIHHSWMGDINATLISPTKVAVRIISLPPSMMQLRSLLPSWKVLAILHQPQPLRRTPSMGLTVRLTCWPRWLAHPRMALGHLGCRTLSPKMAVPSRPGALRF
jgi:extracellular elastinolytic metalloproteinase